MEKPKAHISKKKERIVNDLTSLMKEYPVIGVIDMTSLPALQFHRMKAKLSDYFVFRMVKKRLMKIALDKAKSERKGIEQLKDKLTGIPAMIFTREDPFKLAKLIKKEASNAGAKAGQEAPEDLIVSAGPTPFLAGPMIGELGVMGLKTTVQEGKIHIKEDKVLVKKGEKINQKAADLLAKLGMEPMRIGLNLLLTFKDGETLLKDVLFVDEKMYFDTLQQFARESLELAVYVGYACKETMERIISKAEREAKAVSSFIKLDEKLKEAEAKKMEEKIETKQEQPKAEEKLELEQVKAETKEEEIKLEEATAEKLKIEPVKDVTKEQMESAAKKLQELTDKAIKLKERR